MLHFVLFGLFVLQTKSQYHHRHHREKETGVVPLPKYFQTPRQNGTQCVTNVDCGMKIRCENGYCACRAGGKHLTFDRIQKKCAAIAGTNCSDDFLCVSNATCDLETRKCTCEPTQFSASSFGECRLNYGEACSTNGIYCNAEKFLGCSLDKQVCTCANDDEQVYEEVTGSCLARPMERCELQAYGMTPHCVPNSNCVAAKNNSTEFGICVCADGFENTDSSCLSLYGSPCSQSSACAPRRNLECSLDNGMASICICKTGEFNASTQTCQEFANLKCPPNSVVDPRLDVCRIKVNDPCDSAADICVRNAVCENGVCQCTRYYFPADDGNCQFIFGSLEPDAPSAIHSGCDVNTLLKCLKCHCFPTENLVLSNDDGNCSTILEICKVHVHSMFKEAKCSEFAKLFNSTHVFYETATVIQYSQHPDSKHRLESSGPDSKFVNLGITRASFYFSLIANFLWKFVY